MNDIVKKSFGINFKILKFLTIYPRKTGFCTGRVFLLFAFTHEVLFTAGFPFLGILQLMIQSNMDIYQVVDSLFVLSQMALFPFKHLPFLVYNERLDEVIGKLHSKSFTDILPEQKQIIHDSLRLCKLIYKLFSCMCFGCCFFYSLRPLYLNILTPTEIWWPVKIESEHSITRYLIWFYCNYSGCHGVVATSAIDPLISGLLIHVTGQVKILKDNLRFAGIRSEREVSTFEEPEKTRLKRKILKEKLLECARHYNDIIQFILNHSRI